MLQLVISVFAAGWAFTGIWKTLENVDPRVRYFTTFSQGLAADAPVGPMTEK